MADSLMPYMNGDVTRWANDKVGKMEFFSDIDFFNTISCRFIEYDEHTDEPVYAAEEQPEKCPVVARGFSAFILNNLRNPSYKKEVDFYEDYYRTLRNRHLDGINIIPGASHRDLEEEVYKNHVYMEKINFNASAPVFDYLIKSDRSMLQAYNRYYLEYIWKYSKYCCKQYSSFDQAISSCDTNDKILLHSILNFCTPANKRPLDVYNDIVMLRANYIKAPGYCSEYIQDNYKTEWKEYAVILHTIKTTFEPTADIQLLIPRVYADEQTLKAYELQINECRQILTPTFVTTPKNVLTDENPENNGDTGNRIYDYDTQKVKKIYAEYNDYLFEEVREVVFYNIIANAALNELKIKEGMKAKFLYMIYTLNQVIQDKNWYKTASRSINTEPLRCSGARVDFIWKKRASSLIK